MEIFPTKIEIFSVFFGVHTSVWINHLNEQNMNIIVVHINYVYCLVYTSASA